MGFKKLKMIFIFCDGAVSETSMGIGNLVCKTKKINNYYQIETIIYLQKIISKELTEIYKHHYEFFSIIEGLKLIEKMNIKEEVIIFNDCFGTIDLLFNFYNLKIKDNFKHKELFSNYIKMINELDFSLIKFQWLSRKNKGIQITDKLSKPYHNDYFVPEITILHFEQWQNELKKVTFFEESPQQAMDKHQKSLKEIVSIFIKK